MEFIILAIVAFLALIYLFSFLKRGIKGDCACKGTCSANCKSKKNCEKNMQ